MTRPEDAFFSLNINGYASFSRLADRASVRLAITHTDTNKQDVSEKVLTTARAIEQQLEAIQTRFKKTRDEKPQHANQDTSLPISHWSKTTLTSTSRVDQVYDTDEDRKKHVKHIRRYTAHVDFDLRFRDFEALGDFTSTTAGVEYCEMKGVDWYLLPSTKKAYESRLRRAAAADAMAKAKDYCSIFCPDVDKVNIKPHNFMNESNSAAFNYSSSRAQNMMQQQMPHMQSQFSGGSGNASSGLAFTPQECKLELTISMLFYVETKGFVMPLRDDTMEEE